MDAQVLNKIKKCLALSASSEPHEAAAALRQAQKLMALHGVTAAQLTMADIGEAQVRSRASVSRVKDWELALLNMVAKAFGCQLMWAKSHSYNQNVFGAYTLVGLKSQVELAQYTAEVLQRKLMAGRAKFVSALPTLARAHKTAEADGFCKGWVVAVSKTVHEFALGDETKAAITDYVDERTTHKAKVQRRAAGSYGFHAGEQAGAEESIHRPINTSSQKYLK